MDKNTHSIQSYLRQISDILLINGGFLDSPGLYTGEMGLVLFLSRYARFTQNKIYSDYSSGLMEKIKNKIHQDTPVDYKKGLTGIGCAIEYLAQNGFLKTDTDDILNDFDKRIFYTYNLPYLPIDRIVDSGYYALWRMSGNSAQKDMIRQTILPQIVHMIAEWCTNHHLKHPTVSFFWDIISSDNQDCSVIPLWHQLCSKDSPYCLKTKSYEPLLDNFLNTAGMNDLNLGFQNGLAGLGISLLSELDGDDSWISLFPNDLIK